jgi:hypothetical protein
LIFFFPLIFRIINKWEIFINQLIYNNNTNLKIYNFNKQINNKISKIINNSNNNLKIMDNIKIIITKQIIMLTLLSKIQCKIIIIKIRIKITIMKIKIMILLILLEMIFQWVPAIEKKKQKNIIKDKNNLL